MQRVVSLSLVVLLLLIEPVRAYIGPGVGGGTVAVVLGILAAVFLALVSILWYPLKRAVKARKAKRKAAEIEQP